MFLLSAFTAVDAQQLAFPGAEGYGKYATGGRGGKVVEVTNLNDAGAGSFRDAFTQYPNEPITIVFKVGGTITLVKEIKVTRSNITIAGQTAPGDGICLQGHSFMINGARAISLGGNHGNIVIRHLRSRPGAMISTGVYGFDMENCHDVIVDHCSFSWANEECAAMYDTKNVTVQYSIVSEGLFRAGHAKGDRSYGGGWPTYVSAEAPADQDYDGMADEWETSNGLNPADPADGNAAGADGFTMLEKYLNSLAVNQVLPLRLNSFNGSRISNAINLFWSTSQEAQTAVFTVERSADGASFTAIATIAAQNAAGNHQYAFKDEHAGEGVSYYRLLMKDKDGRTTYSQVLSFNNRLTSILSVFPNPATSNITITHPRAASEAEMKIYGMEGRLLLSYKMMTGSEQSSIDISTLPQGMYSILFINKKEQSVQQFIKR